MGMDFYFPDSQDQVDPNFDLLNEKHPAHHVRQRDDRYAHETLTAPAYDGFLVSLAIVDGLPGASGKYTVAQRRRIYDQRAERFFRLRVVDGRRLKSLGDCGAFAYLGEEEPPIAVDDALDFYEGCGFDAGISVDHIVTGYRSDNGQGRLFDEDPHVEEWERRREITLSYADDFIRRHRERDCRFEPVGSAQGWSAETYADSVKRLQAMGFERIALGGMVPLKTPQILDALSAVDDIRLPETRLHLLGVTRTEHVHEFAGFGVASFDSTSPFRRAFKDDTKNYWTLDTEYTAVRVPPVDGNAKVKRLVASGALDQNQAIESEQRCLTRLRAFDRDDADVDEVLEALHDYHQLWDQRDRREEYRRTLESRAWKDCDCGVCDQVGIEVAIFRGTERNKRRGFHNVAIFNQRFHRHLAMPQEVSA